MLDKLPKIRFSISGKGFTLIELLTAITIVAILSTVGLTVYSQSQLLARDARRKQDLRAIATGLEFFYQQHRRFPCSANSWGQWADSGDSASWLFDKGPTCAVATAAPFEPTYINKLPKDPNGNDSSPLVSGSGYGYAYWSGNSGPLGGTCVSGDGQSFILVARLENASDADSAAKAGTKACDGKYFYHATDSNNYNATYRPESYIIAN